MEIVVSVELLYHLLALLNRLAKYQCSFLYPSEVSLLVQGRRTEYYSTIEYAQVLRSMVDDAGEASGT